MAMVDALRDEVDALRDRVAAMEHAQTCTCSNGTNDDHNTETRVTLTLDSKAIARALLPQLTNMVRGGIGVRNM